MADYGVTITNIDEIRAAFRKAPELMLTELNKAIQKSIFTIETASKQVAPVRTGYMRASERTTFTPLKGVLDWPDTPNPQATSRRPAPVSLYTFYVHDGTKYMAARPFLLDSLNASQVVVDDFFHTAVQNVLDEIARESNE